MWKPCRRLALFVLALSAIGAAQTVQVEPAELTFEVEVGAPSPAPQTFQITSSPSGARFAAQVKAGLISAPFLSLFPTNGDTPSEVTVEVNSDLFRQPGRRTADIEVRLPESGATAFVKVTIDVLPGGTSPRIKTTPESLTFSIPAPGAASPAQPLVVSNDGAGILNYSIGVSYPANAPQGWLAIDPATGEVSFDAANHSVSLGNTEGIEEGEYTAQLLITAEGASNSPLSVPVTLLVGASPTISVTPQALEFRASEGGAFPAIQTVTVRNQGGGALVYQIAGDQDWLFVRPAGGDATGGPVLHEVVPDIRGLPQGTYTGNLVITSEALGTPFQIPVTLAIGAPSRIFTLPSALDFIGNSGIPVREQRLVSVVNTPLSPGGWTATIEPAEANGWLSVTPDAGETPGHLTVSVDTAGLGAATLEADLVLRGRQTSGVTEEGKQQGADETRIPVRLTVLTSSPALGVSPRVLRFQGLEGQNEILEQAMLVENNGGPALNWSATTATDVGGDWLSAAPTSGLAPTPTRVSVSTAGLPRGVYRGQVLVAAGDQNAAVPVELVISQREPLLDTDRTAIYWETTDGGPAPGSATVQVLNRGVGQQAWTAAVSEYTGATGWLTVEPNSGTARPISVAGDSSFTLTADATGLAPGMYGAVVEVEGAADRAPRLLTVMMRVAPAGEPIVRRVTPSGLVFVSSAASPADPQTLEVSRQLASEVDFQTGVAPVVGGNWLEVTPQAGATDAEGLATLQASADVDGLPAGIYRSLASTTFGDGLVESVWATLVVPPASSGTPCVPSAIVAAPMSPHVGFRAVGGRALDLRVRLLDNCGRSIDNGTVTAWFSNGDSAVALKPAGGGIYAGTAAPGNALSQTNVRFEAGWGAFSDSVTVIGSTAGSQAPRISRNGVVNAASFAAGQGVAPGEIISVFGRFEAGPNQEAGAIPLPTELGTTSLILGGEASPLYFSSPGQINAQAPFELREATPTQAAARVGREITVPEELAVSSASPGLFFLPAATGLNRAIVQNQDGSLNSPENPAAPGEAVVAYLTGIGRTDPPTETGAASASAEPLARASAPFSIHVGDAEAQAIFLGMTPNFVGLAQANFFIPEAAPTGDSVELVIRVDGRPSAPLAIAVAAGAGN